MTNREIALPTDPDELYRWHERIAIKMESGIPAHLAEQQASEELERQQSFPQ